MNLFLRRPSLAAAIGTALVFLLLIGLGIWQVQRLFWKLDLIHQIETRLTAPPVALPAGPIDPEQWRYRRVFVRGTFHHDQEIHLFAANARGVPGFLVFTPLQRPDGSIVFIDRGWVPDSRKDPGTRPAGQVKGPVTVVGVVRAPWPRHMFVGKNLPKQNIWFYGDIDAMAAHLGIRNYSRVFVDADATPNPGGLPEGGQARVNLPNNHLQYAITWFALAIVLIVMFVYAHRVPQEAPLDPEDRPHA